MLRAEIHRLTQANEETSTKYKREIDELKEKNDFLENEILTMKSSQAHHQDLKINIERLEDEIQLNVYIYLYLFLFLFRSQG